MADKSKGKKTTRLMITKMVLENFKSYAGVQNIGPFHKRFSSIVGPNGSGKSNVIDALLFVFGKRAKQLRLNKVSELIHKSSAFPNLEYANVEVHFQLINDFEDHDDNFEVIPGSEFIVSRTAYQNNQSKYTVDGKNLCYSDVGTLLRSYGIDLDNNRFLILQGEVEQIAMMKPKGIGGSDDGLLEYLEDIIGTNKYKEPIDECSKVLDQLNEKRIEKVNRMKIAERDRDNLSGSRQEAEEYLEKERDIRRKQNILYQIFQQEAMSVIEDAEKKKIEGVEKLNYERKKHEENSLKMANMGAAYEETLAKFEQMNDELSKATENHSAYSRRQIKLTGDKKHITGQIRNLEALIVKESKREGDGSKDSEKLKKEISDLSTRINDLEEQRTQEEQKLDEIMGSLQSATVTIREQVEVKQGELGKAQSLVSQIQIEKETNVTALQLVLSRSENAKKIYDQSNEKLASIQADLSSGKQKQIALTSQKTELTKKVATLKDSVVHNREKESNLQIEFDSAVSSLESAKVAVQNSGAAHSKVTEAIMKAAKKNGPLSQARIRGRLGDLASISSEYDVAVSTACGMLDHIVVETVEGGQACLDFLRETKLGRANIIVLEKMDVHRKNMERAFTVPNGSHRLFDLITASAEDLTPAFYYALGNTLVAPNLDSAMSISYVGDKATHRVVTLDGKLVETSGAMSGGGSKQKSGGMRIHNGNARSGSGSDGEISADQIVTMEEGVKVLQGKLNECRAECMKAEKDLKEASSQLKQIEVDIEKLKMQLNRISEQDQELNERINEVRGQVHLQASEIDESNRLKSKIAELDERISVTCPNLSSLQAEVASLQEQILNIGGPKLKRTQLRISEYSEKLDELRKNISSKEVEFNGINKQSGKSRQAIEKARAEVDSLQGKFNALVEEEKEMEKDASNLVTALENATSIRSAQSVALEQTKTEYEELKKLLSNIKIVEVDIQTNLDAYNREIKDNKEMYKSWSAKLKDIRRIHLEEKTEMKELLRSFELSKTIPSSSAAIEEAATTMDVENPEEDNLSDMPIFSKEEMMEKFGFYTEKVNSKVKEEKEDLKRGINLLEVERDKLKSNVNMGALMEYLRKDADYRMRLVELEGVTAERNVARKQFEDLRRKRLEEFMSGFGVITLKLKEMYQMITLGGDAELELVDSLDPFSEGIVFSVRPPKKSWKNISNLSGGEKTLSSLALVFALHHYKPTPLYVMDEIDAALDFKNVSIVANYIKERTKNAQFVIISLRNNMFELADRLVGIYKTFDCTKSVTINPKLFDKLNVAVNDGGANNTSKLTEVHKNVLKDSTNVHR